MERPKYPVRLQFTRKELLLSAVQPVAVNYYLIHVRAFVTENTYYRLRFVLPFDLDLDSVDGMTLNESVSEMVYSILSQKKTVPQWIDFCNGTIDRFYK